MGKPSIWVSWRLVSRVLAYFRFDAVPTSVSHYSGRLVVVQAIRGQSGLVMETANAKAAAEILEAKNRAEELEVSAQ